MDDFVTNFKNPSQEYRSAPFWAWNDYLESTEIKRQLKDMKQGGMAGGFVHSRIGLLTPYLSARWMACVKCAVNKAEELEIPLYLYDEDRWPSGYAGGVAAKETKHAMKVLRISKQKTSKIKILTLPPSETFNGTPYLDTLSEESVENFVESAYVPYKKVLGEKFGNTIPAIFTDEPNMLSSRGCDKERYYFLPWTKDFAKIFRKKYGYSILENAAKLIENCGDYKAVRYHYRKLLTELFVHSFGEQIYNWCDRNKIALTGHYNAEDTISAQIEQLGAAMPLYEYMHIPGVDHLRRQLDSTFLTIKQCSSVANQLGKERVLSELFATSGQAMSFEDRKWIANWNIVLGANFLCPHLWLYSMAGRRKRDCPPTISSQQPYWKYNKLAEDYFARLCYITSRGRFQAKILVIHPVESGWCLYSPKDTAPTDEINEKFVKILRTLSANHYDYDLGDETLIEKYGSILCKENNQCFKMGEMLYEIVVIPPTVTLRSFTLNLLEDFKKSGGTVIGFTPLFERIDGKETRKKISEFYSGVSVFNTCGKKFLKKIDEKYQKNISIKKKGTSSEISDIYCQVRRATGRFFYLMVNNSRDKSYEAIVSIPKSRYAGEVLELWDPETGKITHLQAKKNSEDWMDVNLFFPPVGALLISSGSRHLASPESTLPSESLKTMFKMNNEGWKLRQKDLNCLTLDFCRYKIGARWCSVKYVLDVQNSFEQRLNNDTPFMLKYSFRANFKESPEPVYLVVERPEQYEIRVNGTQVGKKLLDRWLDLAFTKIDISGLIKNNSENTVEMKSRFKCPRKSGTLKYVEGGTEIESVYILGNFNVSGSFRKAENGYFGSDFVLTDAQPPDARETIVSGYPFYAGSFIFSREFNFSPKLGKRYFARLKVPGAVVSRVKVNGKQAGVCIWEPNTVEITECLLRGSNEFEVEITGSLRNLLGPHHLNVINPIRVSNYLFNYKEDWTGEFGFIQFGIKNILILEAEATFS